MAIQYIDLDYRPSEVEHKYGNLVHISKDPTAQTLLAQFCRPDMFLPTLNLYVEKLYQILLKEVLNVCFPRETVSWKTRMHELSEAGVFEGEVV